MIEINLPEETKSLIDGSVFKLDDSIDDTLLAKFLFYVPSVVREYGLAIAELKRQKREEESDLLGLQSDLDRKSAEILLELDTALYKNESMRSARIESDTEVIGIKELILIRKRHILGIESDIDELTEQYWSFKSLRDSLESITKLRIAECSF